MSGAPFVSGQSVSQQLLATGSGFEPVSLVTGNSVYRVSWAVPSKSGEIDALTQAYREGLTLALARMQEKARHLGANGVIGARIARQGSPRRGKAITFSAIGTAVRIAGAPPAENPFLSDLSGQEIWALKSAGFSPAGLAFGNCVWHEAASFETMQAAGVYAHGVSFGGNPSSRNQELADYARAVYRARSLAMMRLEEDCVRLGAAGIVAADIRKEIRPASRLGNALNLIVSFQVLGTALARIETGSRIGSIDYRLSLGDSPGSDPIFLGL